MMSRLLPLLVRFLTGIQRHRIDTTGNACPCVYYANHTSHLDFLVIWSALPHHIRRHTRPVAAKDYWTRTRVRLFFARRVFRAILIDRTQVRRSEDPIALMQAALEAGDSVIIFPEGTRGEEIGEFRSGIHHLAERVPDLDFVPVYLDNLNRVLPKGEFLPLPVLCSIVFGRTLRLEREESRADFLARARQAIVEMKP